MSDIDGLAKEIINELKRINRLSPLNVAKEWEEKRNFPLPGMLARGDGHGTIISPKIDANILKIRNFYSNQNKNLKTTYKDEELHKLFERALGLSIATIDLNINDDENVNKIKLDLKTYLDSQLKSYGVREHAFGCTLFMDKGQTAPFSIGPVLFESREVWLDRKKKEGHISSNVYEHIKDKWTDSKFEKIKIENNETLISQSICESIGSASYVCSVTVNGFPPDICRSRNAPSAGRTASKPPMISKARKMLSDGTMAK